MGNMSDQKKQIKSSFDYINSSWLWLGINWFDSSMHITLIMAKTQFHAGRNKIRKIKIKLLKHNIYPDVTYLTGSTIKNSERHIKNK